MLHPFFKQAKRKDYLIKTILVELPPLELRPRKIMPQKQVTITKTDEWDFDDDGEEEEEEELLDPNHDHQQLQKQQQVQDNSKKPPNTKRHISFGDVVVRNNSMIHPAETSPPPPPTHNTVSGTPPRKSRFVIEEANNNNADTFNSSSVRSSSPMLEDEHVLSDGEVMKGRFYVNQQNKPVTFNDTPIIHHHQQTDEEERLHKMPSTDAFNVDRKSRFEISSSATNSPMLYQPIPLSRDSSSYSSSSNGRSNNNTTHTNNNTTSIPNTTAVTEKRYPMDTSTLTTENIALLTESSRKIGRFELTGGSACSSVDVTPRGSISSSHVDHLNTPAQHHHHQSQLSIDSNQFNPQYQIEELIRFNESQRLILQELSSTFKKPTPSTAPAPATMNNAIIANSNEYASSYFDSVPQR